jgi:hypothetical protein
MSNSFSTPGKPAQLKPCIKCVCHPVLALLILRLCLTVYLVCVFGCAWPLNPMSFRFPSDRVLLPPWGGLHASHVPCLPATHTCLQPRSYTKEMTGERKSSVPPHSRRLYTLQVTQHVMPDELLSQGYSQAGDWSYAHTSGQLVRLMSYWVYPPLLHS